MDKNSKIYIAGHKGLVGSAILNTLRLKGYTNFVVRSHVELDLTDQKAVADFFEAEKPDYVFLAAAKVGGIAANNKLRGAFIYENLMIQNNVIHQSYLNGVKKLLFLGSSCIYPKNCTQPMKETYLLKGPLEYTNEPYAIAKIAGVKMCESYNLQYGTNFIAVQPTNLYGPNDNFDLEKSHVIPALIRKMHLAKALEQNDWKTIKKDLNKLTIENVSDKNSTNEILKILKKFGIQIENDKVAVEIWGSGKAIRDFLWSEDMAKACVFLMETVNFKDLISMSDEVASNGVNEIRNTHVNIGTAKGISIMELTNLIKRTVKFNGSISFNDAKPDGTMKKVSDSSKLHNLGWKHAIELEEGIEKMYDWYTNNLDSQ